MIYVDYTSPEENIKKEKAEITKWFEELLNVKNITFKKKVSQEICDGFMYKDLQLKVLYYDTINNVLSTNSPYGCHWEKAKHIVKLKSFENIRWIITADILIDKLLFRHALGMVNDSTVYIEDYNGKVKILHEKK